MGLIKFLKKQLQNLRRPKARAYLYGTTQTRNPPDILPLLSSSPTSVTVSQIGDLVAGAMVLRYVSSTGLWVVVTEPA
jgi:hypothetical protein